MKYLDPRGGWNRYKIQTDFFKKWSDEMAYVLGFLYADGNITDATVSTRTQYIKFSSKDKDILSAIKATLQAEHPVHSCPPRETVHRDGKIYRSSRSFHLRIGNKRMFGDLEKIGLTPNKSKTAKFPFVPNRYLGNFIRGYFDGDGCVRIAKGKGKRRKIILKKLLIAFTSGSKIFLEGLNTNIKNITKVQRKKVYDSHWSYQLCYCTSDSVELFKFLYKNVPKNLYLQRKFNIFKEYFKLRPSRIDKDVERIIIKYGQVAK